MPTVKLLRRPKVGGFIQHVGFEFTPNQVVHNGPERGHQIVTKPEYAEGLPVEEHVFEVSQERYQAMWERAVSRNGWKYDPLMYNCESALNWVLNGEDWSPSSRAFACCALLGLIALALSGTSAGRR